MLINYGCEIGISVPRATPLICLLDVHPERRKDINSEAPFQTRPPTQAMMYLDGFGNQSRRLMVPPGDITLRLDGTILDSGKPDEVAPERARSARRNAAALPARLPARQPLLRNRPARPSRLGSVRRGQARAGRACRRFATSCTTT